LDFFFEKNENCLELPDLGRKLIRFFKGYSADTCGEKFPLTSMGGWAEGLACADLGARTP
jgi:hypothetical protein